MHTINELTTHVIFRLFASLLSVLLLCILQLFLEYGNSLQVYNHETFLQYFGREKNVPLLTFCNHHSMLDDPGLVGEFWYTFEFSIAYCKCKLLWTLLDLQKYFWVFTDLYKKLYIVTTQLSRQFQQVMSCQSALNPAIILNICKIRHVAMKTGEKASNC